MTALLLSSGQINHALLLHAYLCNHSDLLNSYSLLSQTDDTCGNRKYSEGEGGDNTKNVNCLRKRCLRTSNSFRGQAASNHDWYCETSCRQESVRFKNTCEC